MNRPFSSLSCWGLSGPVLSDHCSLWESGSISLRDPMLVLQRHRSTKVPDTNGLQTGPLVGLTERRGFSSRVTRDTHGSVPSPSRVRGGKEGGGRLVLERRRVGRLYSRTSGSDHRPYSPCSLLEHSRVRPRLPSSGRRSPF